jgi:hypothetical protein
VGCFCLFVCFCFSLCSFSFLSFVLFVSYRLYHFFKLKIQAQVLTDKVFRAWFSILCFFFDWAMKWTFHVSFHWLWIDRNIGPCKYCVCSLLFFYDPRKRPPQTSRPFLFFSISSPRKEIEKHLRRWICNTYPTQRGVMVESREEKKEGSHQREREGKKYKEFWYI